MTKSLTEITLPQFPTDPIMKPSLEIEISHYYELSPENKLKCKYIDTYYYLIKDPKFEIEYQINRNVFCCKSNIETFDIPVICCDYFLGSNKEILQLDITLYNMANQKFKTTIDSDYKLDIYNKDQIIINGSYYNLFGVKEY